MSGTGEPLLGAVEAGGTKFVCAVGTGPDDLRTELRLETRAPDETLDGVVAFFHEAQARHGPLAALGVGSFGPVDLASSSPSYGHITTTPKPGWAQTDIVGRLRGDLGVPVGFDTDVNAAALGEHRWGAAAGLDSVVYLTVGTGIGGGAVVDGRPLHGLLHPEMGHIPIPHDHQRDPYAGVCPYHGDCLEGLASGPAIGARWGRPAGELPVEHEAWPLQAHYLALGLVHIICILSPQRLILGGGVMEQTQLFPLIRAEVRRLLAGYLRVPSLDDAGGTDAGIDGFIVSPGLGTRAGICGALDLAERALQEEVS